ncbi:UNVERIFIED_CONTAM: hypothetical protein Slati_3721400 [Sesamum latifolium]|uniref:DUF4283 domain-containing protein n=1 Tax=Sesamum latifolium TaxID=2727402 RepID=A0AAW2U3Q8_9LAMI
MGFVTGSKEVQVVLTPSKAGLSLAQLNHVDSVQQSVSIGTSRRAPNAENPSSDAAFAGSLEDIIAGAKSNTVPAAAATPHVELSTGIFIGKVPLREHAPPLQLETRFADAFNNSSRKTLRFVPPDNQKGEVSTYVRSVWPCVKDVIATSNGFFFIQFNTCAVIEEVIEGGPWLFQGRPIVLQKWELGLALRKHAHTQVPICIKLRHLLVELWTTDGLSTIASGVGKPLYPDAITKAGTRLDFARVCVMVNFTSALPKHLVVILPTEDGGEHPCRVDVEYERVPSTCLTCRALGHSTAGCPSMNKPTKPPVAVYVQKPQFTPTVEPLPTVMDDERVESELIREE